MSVPATPAGPDDRASDPTAVVPNRPKAAADPGPLGLSAFALTTFLLSMVNTGLIDKASEPIVFGMALAFGGIAQVLAGMWEFHEGNTFGATAFTAFGAFWLSFWALVQFYLADIPEAQVGDAVGLYLIAWAIFTAYMTIASLRTTRWVNITFVLLTVTFLLLGLGDLTDTTSLTKAGGWFGLATAAAAAYAAAAGVTKSTFGRDVLPNPSLAQ